MFIKVKHLCDIITGGSHSAFIVIFLKTLYLYLIHFYHFTCPLLNNALMFVGSIARTYRVTKKNRSNVRDIPMLLPKYSLRSPSYLYYNKLMTL